MSAKGRPRAGTVRTRRTLWWSLALGAGAALLLAELVLRHWGYGNPVRYAPDETLLWTIVPSQTARIPGLGGAITINSLGLRGPERSIEKPGGTHRLLVLGDSVTFGIQVDDSETFPALLETLLRSERRAGPVEVWNAGVPGYSLEQEVRYLEGTCLSFEPDTVLVAVCPNDWAPPLDRDSGRQVVAEASLSFRSRMRRIAVFDSLRLALAAVSGRRGARPGADGSFERRVIDLDGEKDREILGHLEATLSRSAARCRAADSRLVLVLLPQKSQLARNPDPSVQSLLLAFAARVDIPCLDLLPAFAARRDGTTALFTRDRDSLHFSPEGHRLAATEILAFLLREGIIR